MKKFSALMIILTAFVLTPAAAQDFGISLSTFSSLYGDVISGGSFGRVGLLVPSTQRTEFELAAAMQVNPNFAGSALFSAQLSYALLSPLFMQDSIPLYPNMCMGAGIFMAISDRVSYGPCVSFTPLTTGGPEFLRKERLAAVTAMYDVNSGKLGVFLQLFVIDFYLH